MISAGTAPGAVEVLITRLDRTCRCPASAHAGDAGSDLYAAADVDLAPGQRADRRHRGCIALPAGYAAFVHPRSGLAAEHGVTIVNAPGTVDAGYRGEIKVILLNTDAERSVRLQAGRPDRPACDTTGGNARYSWKSTTLPGSQRGDGRSRLDRGACEG